MLFMTAMSAGEAVGPMLGGVIVGFLGFAMATGVLGGGLLPFTVTTLVVGNKKKSTLPDNEPLLDQAGR